MVVSESESDEYFSSRPFESQIGAWVSNQSEVVNSRAELDEKFIELCGDFADQQVKRPHYWGGFKVIPDRVEFWQGRPNRLNDRILYTLNQSVECGWKIERLAP